MFNEVTRCRICGNNDLRTILNLGNQALTGVFPASTDKVVPAGPLDLVQCSGGSEEVCGLVQLRHSYSSELMYGKNYGYRSGLNQSMVDHLRNKAQAIKKIARLSAGSLVLDIGSNDGTLLRAMQEPDIDLVGMDPSGVKFRQYYPESAQLLGEFFSADRFRREFGTRRASVVTSIAMFYDLEDPTQFMRDIHEVLTDEGVWLFEQSYLPAMIEMNAYDTVCHEHIEYYALKQIFWMAKRAGFKILDVEFNDVNGGSFSVMAAKEGSARKENSAAIRDALDKEQMFGLDSPEVYSRFSDFVFRHREELPRKLEQLKTEGQKVFGYGASTKGNVVLQFCGITPGLVPAIAEVNSDKFGCFTPGTGIPIVSEMEARNSGADVYLVLPWHFREGIIRRESAFLESGGRLLFPLPMIELTNRAQSAGHRA